MALLRRNHNKNENTQLQPEENAPAVVEDIVESEHAQEPAVVTDTNGTKTVSDKTTDSLFYGIADVTPESVAENNGYRQDIGSDEYEFFGDTHIREPYREDSATSDSVGVTSTQSSGWGYAPYGGSTDTDTLDSAISDTTIELIDLVGSADESDPLNAGEDTLSDSDFRAELFEQDIPPTVVAPATQTEPTITHASAVQNAPVVDRVTEPSTIAQADSVGNTVADEPSATDATAATSQPADEGSPMAGRTKQLRTREGRSMALHATKLCSEECVLDGDARTPIISGIDFEVLCGDCYAISGNRFNDVLITTEIVANMRSYYSGEIRLFDSAVGSSKRVLNKNIFYFDDYTMTYPNMTVLEQMMMVLSVRVRRNETAAKQNELLDVLITLGMKDVCLTKLKHLDDGMRMIVTLLVAGLSDSRIVVANLLKYELTQHEIEVLARVVDYLQDTDKTVILASLQAKLIGMVCDGVLYMYDGRVGYAGPIQDMLRAWDKTVCLVYTSDVDGVKRLVGTFANMSCVVERDCVIVKYYGDTVWDRTTFVGVLLNSDLDIQSIKFNKGRVANSFEEIERNVV